MVAADGNAGRSGRHSNVHGADATDPATDDPLGHHTAPNGKGSESPVRSSHHHLGATDASGQPRQGMVHPLVRVRSEYSILHRKDPTGQNGKQNVVCVVTVEMPSRRPPPSPEEEEAKNRMQWRNLATYIGDDSLEGPGTVAADSSRDAASIEEAPDGHRQRESSAATSAQDESGDEEGFSYGVTPAPGNEAPTDPHEPVLEDLRQRIIDWKGQTMERFGPLVLYDYLGVRQDAIVRQFWVYLFSWGVFHILEFVVTAHWNPTRLMRDCE